MKNYLQILQSVHGNKLIATVGDKVPQNSRLKRNGKLLRSHFLSLWKSISYGSLRDVSHPRFMRSLTELM